MNTPLLILAGLILATLVIILFLLLLRKPTVDPALHTQLAVLQGALDATRQDLASNQAGLRSDMGQRLDLLSDRTTNAVQSFSDRTSGSLDVMRERLQVLDAAAQTMEHLAKRVTSLDQVLSNKQTRGMLGETQLTTLLQDTLPTPYFSLQHTLSSGKRVDAFVNIGTHWMGIDAKFPLVSYQTLINAPDKNAEDLARKKLRQDVLAHIKAVGEKYILPGETADGAFLFVPAESIYAEIHHSLPDVVRDAITRKVWIVSPSTLMAALMTVRAMTQDAELLNKAGIIRKELTLLSQDIDRLMERSETLNKALEQATTASGNMLLSARKIHSRGQKISTLEF